MSRTKLEERTIKLRLPRIVWKAIDREADLLDLTLCAICSRLITTIFKAQGLLDKPTEKERWVA